jgi:hypothetical protein
LAFTADATSNLRQANAVADDMMSLSPRLGLALVVLDLLPRCALASGRTKAQCPLRLLASAPGHDVQIAIRGLPPLELVAAKDVSVRFRLTVIAAPCSCVVRIALRNPADKSCHVLFSSFAQPGIAPGLDWIGGIGRGDGPVSPVTFTEQPSAQPLPLPPSPLSQRTR